MPSETTQKRPKKAIPKSNPKTIEYTTSQKTVLDVLDKNNSNPYNFLVGSEGSYLRYDDIIKQLTIEILDAKLYKDIRAIKDQIESVKMLKEMHDSDLDKMKIEDAIELQAIFVSLNEQYKANHNVIDIEKNNDEVVNGEETGY